MKKIYFMLNLRHFDGEAAPAAAAGAATGIASATGAKSTPPDAAEAQGEVTPEIIYGKPMPDNQSPDASDKKTDSKNTNQTIDPKAREAEFEKLIQGEYKELFDKRIKKIINSRFKDTKTLESRVQTIEPIIDMLCARYGIKDGNIEKLSKAIEDDDALYEQEALEMGLSVEQLKYLKKTERQNMMLQRRLEAIEAEKKANEIINDWKRQAESLKDTFPGLNLDVEITNEQFAAVLRATGSVRAAYQAVHFDEIVPALVKTTSQKVQEQTVNNIKSRASRPHESGVNSSQAMIIKNDPSKWTDNEYKEVIRRVRQGAKIYL